MRFETFSITTLEPPSVIRSEALQNVPSPAAPLAKKRLRIAARHEINAPPAVPTNLNFEIGQAYRTYTSTDGVEELFLLGDSGVYYENGNENPQRNAVTALDTEFGNLVAFRPLIDWLLDKYVGRPRPNGTWSQPLFRPDQWKVYQRTLEGNARTNNNAEAEHHRLQGAFNCRHPSLWHFIDVLLREQRLPTTNTILRSLDCHLRKARQIFGSR
ncbi:hypothetical protein niasHS_009546 [Heterodera schachtii]|uniref:Uncharacterized protein n=1 Tax=Heterodera schachtii TaxID=97005 RepID=A0ABD2JEJ4_HETSC